MLAPGRRKTTIERRARSMSMIWEKDGEGFYATINEPAGEILF